MVTALYVRAGTHEVDGSSEPQNSGVCIECCFTGFPSAFAETFIPNDESLVSLRKRLH